VASGIDDTDTAEMTKILTTDAMNKVKIFFCQYKIHRNYYFLDAAIPKGEK